MKKAASFLRRLEKLLKAIDKEVSEYWWNFFVDEKERD